MIIFYDKKTGFITGTIEGRIHNDLQLKMWIGDKEKTNRIVCQWKKQGKNYIPDNTQTELFTDIDRNPLQIYKYIVDIKTKKLKQK